MDTNVYIPILMTANTNQDWLDALLGQLGELTSVTVDLLEGSPSRDTLPQRRLEVIKAIPEDCNYIFSIDPDDLIVVPVIQNIIDKLKGRKIGGVYIKEASFKTAHPDRLSEETYCCRMIIKKKVAQAIAPHIYGNGILDTGFCKRVASVVNVAYHPHVGYLWRQHDDQLHREFQS